MSAGEVVVWCVGLICSTLVICIAIIAVAFKSSEKRDDKVRGESS